MVTVGRKRVQIFIELKGIYILEAEFHCFNQLLELILMMSMITDPTSVYVLILHNSTVACIK